MSQTSTLSRGLMQSLEFSPLMTGPEHQGLRSNEHPPTAGPYQAANHPNYHHPISYAGNMVHDSLPVPHTTTTLLTGHSGDPTHHGGHHVLIAPGPPQLGYYAPAHPDLPNGPLGYVPVQDNAAEPFQGNPNPIDFGMSDDEDLKRLASRYLNNHGAHVDKLLVRRRFQGDRTVLILLEIDDTL
ncbi:hypothetical protein BC827DRAFT_1162840 [Russula dissimulans]|nr:hypothetical protein BC827DRAFT_1162840 [Russula dissimulans]